MPVALLLQETLGPLLDDRRRLIPFATLALDRERRGLLRLEAWSRIAGLEELLIARARGAFLVHWFGTRIPMAGLAVRAHIANLDHLRRRYRAVREASRRPESGLNLTEPLAGMMGNLAGMLLSPTGIVSITFLARQWLPWWAQVLLVVLGTSVIPALALAVGSAALPLAFGAGLVAGVTQPELLRSVWELLGSVARLIDALNGFLDQLMGPREAIRNPLLRQILEVADRFAVLLPRVLALVALVVARIGPRVRLLALQGAALILLTRSVVDAVRAVITDALDTVRPLLARTGPLRRLVDVFGRIGPALQGIFRRFRKELEAARRRVPDVGLQLMQLRLTWQKAALRVLTKILRAHPTLAVLELLRDQLRDLQRSFASPASSTSASGTVGGGPAVPGWLSSAFSAVFGTPPPPPALPALPDLADIEKRVGRPEFTLDLHGIEEAYRKVPASALEGLKLSPAARAAFARAATPPSVFAREQAALERALGGPVDAALARLRDEELPLREALTALVARVVPPATRSHLPELLELFHTLDARVYGVEGPRPPAFPVVDVPTTRRLRVVIHRLNVRSLGGDEPHAAVFRDRLVRELGLLDYLAPAGVSP